MKNKVERNSNHELMRIISMFFIVIYHTIFHGHMLENTYNAGLTHLLDFTVFITMVHVNSFIILTGYYQCKQKFKQSTIWKLINSVLFYKVLALVLLCCILGVLELDRVTVIKELLPINMTHYWFVKCYMILYCLSPFLNKLIESMNKKEFKRFLIVLLILFSIIPMLTNNGAVGNNGHTLANFICLYFVGAYLRLYPIDKSYLFKKLSTQALRLTLVFVFIFCALIQYLLFNYSKNIGGVGHIFNELSLFIRSIYINVDASGHNYSNIFIIIQSIAYFSFFTTLSFKSKIINKIAPLALGVYLIHDNRYIRRYIYEWVGIDNGNIYSYKYFIYMILAAITIYLICLLIEFIRQVIFKFIYNRKISKKIRDKYYNWLKGIYIKE